MLCTCTSTNVKVLVLYLSTFKCTLPHAWYAHAHMHTYAHYKQTDITITNTLQCTHNTYNLQWLATVWQEIWQGNFDVFVILQPDCQNLTRQIFKVIQCLVKDSDHPSKYFPSNIWRVSICQNFHLSKIPAIRYRLVHTWLQKQWYRRSAASSAAA